MKLTLRQIIGYTVLLIAIAWSGWLVFHLTDQTKKSTSLSKASNGFLIDTTITQFNVDGKPAIKLDTPKLTHYPDDHSTMITPLFTIYPQNATPPWYIRSKHGFITPGLKSVRLWDQVHITHTPEEKKGETVILTTEITIYPSKGYATTDRPVKITQPGLVITSVGATIDKNGKVNLLSEVKGQHKVETTKKQ